MNVNDTEELRRLIHSASMTMDEDGVVAAKPPEPPPVVAPPPTVAPRNDELIAAVQSLETAVRGDAKKDSELLSAVQSLEQAIRAPRKWVFKVERSFEGITQITAESK